MPIERVTQTSIFGIFRKRETVETLPPEHIEKLGKDIPWDLETSAIRTAFRQRLEIKVLDNESLVVILASPFERLVQNYSRSETLSGQINKGHSPEGAILTGQQINDAHLEYRNGDKKVSIRFRQD